MLTLHSIIDASSRAKVLFYGSFSLNRVFLTVGSRMLSNGRTKAWQGTHRRSCMPNKTLMNSSLLGPLCAIAKKSAVSPSNCPAHTWDSPPLNWHFLLLQDGRFGYRLKKILNQQEIIVLTTDWFEFLPPFVCVACPCLILPAVL